MEDDDLIFDAEEMEAIEDTSGDSSLDKPAGTIVSYVKERYTKAETARETEEQRWIRAYRNYRGIYDPNMQFTSTEKSRVFVKVTKTKVLAAYGQIAEVLLGNNKFPITINPTTLPEGVEEAVYVETNPQITEATPQEDTKLLPGETLQQLRERLGPVKDKLTEVDINEGYGQTPSQVTFEPALIAAKKMQKKIHDQLEEAQAKKQLRSAAFECALFGTGIMKGPFAVDKEYPNWDEDGNYNPTIKTVPMTSHVSIWNFYPDPDASNMEEAEYVIERHKMSRSQVRALKNRPFFRENEIDIALEYGESYLKEWWEQAMEDDAEEVRTERFEVLEFWGNVDRKVLEDHDVDIPRDLRKKDSISVNIWVCNGRVLRLVMNPFTPTIIPYYSVPYELNPYSMFGVGVAENMDDTQTLMNGFMRMAVDNAALSGNLLIEVDETNLVPGQDLEVYPGKVFRREGGAPGQAILVLSFLTSLMKICRCLTKLVCLQTNQLVSRLLLMVKQV